MKTPERSYALQALMSQQMTSDERAHFKAHLEALEADFKAHLAGTDPSSTSLAPDNAIGRLTRMEAIQAQHISAAGRRRIRTRLKQVKAALERLVEGTYGQCMRCGEDIPHGRLEIMPETPLCISCARTSAAL